MAYNLITFSQVQLAFGHHPLLDHADFTLQSNERIGLIGRNGAGKSSMLRLLDGRTMPDDGEIIRRSSVRIATVEQEPALDEDATVFNVICGHDTLEEDWSLPARTSAAIEKLGLNPDALISGLSGGTRKRVALARAIVSKPDLLLLDEPTNHLDFNGISWLESMLLNWRGAAVIITHDRHFLNIVTTRIVELDRGRLLSFPGDFSQWQARRAQCLDSERLEQTRFKKLLSQEEIWIRKGVEARRTRNEGRIRRLEQLRAERATRRERVGNVSLALSQGIKSGKLVAELKQVSKSFGEQAVLCNYSTTIFRGDRIGLIGPNGAGKTTLLKLIMGELAPDSGTSRMGTNISVAYFDQMRSQLDERAALVDVISPGSEWIEIGGERKHVKSYLGNFLFSPARTNSPVSSLSGGERARLLLARLFARPANVLIMDEPTNDLDIETLELLEALLQDYAGTVLLVSHDRSFLNNVVTQTIAYEGNAVWKDYIGGYDDWAAQRPSTSTNASYHLKDYESTDLQAVTQSTSSTLAIATSALTAYKSNPCLSPWEQKELDKLPDQITYIEALQAEQTNQLSNSKLYKNKTNQVEQINRTITALQAELDALFSKWEKLESRHSGD